MMPVVDDAAGSHIVEATLRRSIELGAARQWNFNPNFALF